MKDYEKVLRLAEKVGLDVMAVHFSSQKIKGFYWDNIIVLSDIISDDGEKFSVISKAFTQYCIREAFWCKDYAEDCCARRLIRFIRDMAECINSKAGGGVSDIDGDVAEYFNIDNALINKILAAYLDEETNKITKL